MATHRYRAVSSANVDCRHAERLFVAVRRVAVDVAGHAEAEGVLGDVSPFGCRVTIAGFYGQGEALRLRIGGGMEIGATVVWGDGAVIGCRFDKPIARAALRPLMLRE